MSKNEAAIEGLLDALACGISALNADADACILPADRDRQHNLRVAANMLAASPFFLTALCEIADGCGPRGRMTASRAGEVAHSVLEKTKSL